MRKKSKLVFLWVLFFTHVPEMSRAVECVNMFENCGSYDVTKGSVRGTGKYGTIVEVTDPSKRDDVVKQLKSAGIKILDEGKGGYLILTAMEQSDVKKALAIEGVSNLFPERTIRLPDPRPGILKPVAPETTYDVTKGSVRGTGKYGTIVEVSDPVKRDDVVKKLKSAGIKILDEGKGGYLILTAMEQSDVKKALAIEGVSNLFPERTIRLPDPRPVIRP